MKLKGRTLDQLIRMYRRASSIKRGYIKHLIWRMTGLVYNFNRRNEPK